MQTREADRNPLTLLVTGGAGFLGRSIVHEALSEASPLKVKELRIYDLKKAAYPDDPRVTCIQGDIRDEEKLKQVLKGVDVVIHSAAIVDWGTYSEEEILSVNAGGTQKVVEACRIQGVKALIFTSSLDVLYDGKPLRNVDESHPYPGKHSTSYCKSKYLAEKLVIEANSASLLTCSLRPADIYGEGDPYHMGNLIGMAKTGFYVRLGDGTSMCQHVYVGNMAWAHLQAGAALISGNSLVPGESYFVTDDQASNFFTFFDSIVEAAGYRIRPKNLWLPRGLAYGLGILSEAIAWLIRPLYNYRPKMSRFAVTYTCTDYTFGPGKAMRDFGFTPRYSKEVAFEKTVAYFKKPG